MASLKDEKNKIKNAAIEISLLSLNDLRYFFGVFFEDIPEEKRKEIVKIIAGYYFNDKGKWLKIDRWMESCFLNHYDYPPKKVGTMCCKYLKINIRLLPAIIKRARTIKERIRKRKTYSESIT